MCGCFCSVVEAVLWLQATFGLPPAASAEALALHLDSQCIVQQAQLANSRGTECSQSEAEPVHSTNKWEGAPEKQEPDTASAPVWSAFAQLLLSAARSAAQASHSATRELGSSSEQAALDASAGACSMEHSRESAELESWQAVQDVLQSRAWWWGKCILTPQRVRALRMNAAADQLASMAVAATFVLGPSSAFCRDAIEALEGIAAVGELLLVKDAVELSRQLRQPTLLRQAA